MGKLRLALFLICYISGIRDIDIVDTE